MSLDQYLTEESSGDIDMRSSLTGNDKRRSVMIHRKKGNLTDEKKKSKRKTISALQISSKKNKHKNKINDESDDQDFNEVIIEELNEQIRELKNEVEKLRDENAEQKVYIEKLTAKLANPDFIRDAYEYLDLGNE